MVPVCFRVIITSSSEEFHWGRSLFELPNWSEGVQSFRFVGLVSPYKIKHTWHLDEQRWQHKGLDVASMPPWWCGP